MSFHSDAARWRAVSTRDTTAEGHFVYSVKSTKIYCRPTCPGRLARRANVGFYNTAAEAEAAGFRACKRCKPEVVHVEDPQESSVLKACTLIDDAVKDGNPKSLRLRDISRKVGFTPRYFHKIFKDKTGMTPREYTRSMAAPDGPKVSSDTVQDLTMNGIPCLEDFDLDELIRFDIDSMPPLDYSILEPIPGQPVALGSTPDSEEHFQVSVWHDFLDPQMDSMQDLTHQLIDWTSDSAMATVTPTFPTSKCAGIDKDILGTKY